MGKGDGESDRELLFIISYDWLYSSSKQIVNIVLLFIPGPSLQSACDNYRE